MGQRPHHGGAAASSAGDTTEDPVPVNAGRCPYFIYHLQGLKSLILCRPFIKIYGIEASTGPPAAAKMDGYAGDVPGGGDGNVVTE